MGTIRGILLVMGSVGSITKQFRIERDPRLFQGFYRGKREGEVLKRFKL